MLKSKLFLLVMTFFFLFAFSSLQAAVVIVDNTGGALVYTTIQAGINAANPGDSIHVRLGTGAAYAGATVNKSGLRIGAEAGVKVDDGLPIAPGVHGFKILASNCFISGFEIFDFDHAIDIPTWSGASGNTIYNNIIRNNTLGVAIDHPAPPAAYAEFNNKVLSNCFHNQATSPQCYDANLGPASVWAGNSWDDLAGVPPYVIPPAIYWDGTAVGIWTMVQVKPTPSNVGYNTDFDVYVEYVPSATCNYTPVDLMSIEYRITYDATKMSVVDVVNAVPGLIPEPTGGQTIPNFDTAGVIRVAQTFLGGGGAPGPGDLVKITFHADALVAGSTLDLTVINCIEPDQTPIVTHDGDGTVNISDIIAPTIDSISPASGGTYGSAGPTFTKLWASDNIGLWRIQYKLDAGGWVPYGALGASATPVNFAVATNGVFAGFYPGLADGPHTIKFRVQDWYGPPNTSAEVIRLFTKDTAPPSFTSVALADIGLSEPAEAGWSNQLNVQLTIVAGGDATQMYLTGDITSPAPATWIPFAAVSTVTLTAGDGVSKTVNVYVRDAYTNQVGPLSASIWLDMTAPTLTGFVLDAGATYNTTGTASGDFQGNGVNPDWDFFKAKLTGDLTAPTGWTAAVDPVSITLSALDGVKIINAQIRDKAGNTSPIRLDDIILDTSAPSATITLKSQSSATTPPYSTVYTPSNPVDVLISATGNPATMALTNEDLTLNTLWIPFASTYTGPVQWLSGLRKISVWLRDAALNVAGPFDGFITVDVTPPAAPGSFSALPGGSIEFSWTNAAQVARTIIKVNPWNDYPEYFIGPPSYPGYNDSFTVAIVPATGNSFSYSAPHKDIYYCSGFSVDSAGNSSAIVTERATSYVLGDIVPGGSVNFDDVEFFSDYYNTTPATGNAAECDFYPIDYTNAAGGVPTPDDAINFDDLVVLALNYGSGTAKITPVYPSGPIVLNLNIGDKVSVGDEFEAKLTINDANSVKAMHLILDYNNSVLKLLGVTKGELSADPSIFFYADKEKVDISLAKLGKGLVIGGSGEVATLKFKMLSQGTTELTSNLLDVRDVNGKPIEVSFNKVNLAAVPIAFALSQNYPNPFNPKTQISFALPLASKVTLKIYNITGQLVNTLVDAELPAGHHTVTWSGTNSSGSEVGTGIYFYRLQTENFTSVKKMVLMK